MTDKKKLIGSAALLIIALGIVVFLIVLVVGGFKLRSIASSPCTPAPLVINGSQVASIDALQQASGHIFTAAEISNLGIAPCDGGLCTTTCPAVSS